MDNSWVYNLLNLQEHTQKEIGILVWNIRSYEKLIWGGEARNSLVNKVKFLELAHAFATVQPSDIQNILRKPGQKRDNNFYCSKEVLHYNYGSLNLFAPYHLWVISPRNLNFTHQTSSPGGRVGSGDETNKVMWVRKKNRSQDVVRKGVNWSCQQQSVTLPHSHM